MSRLQISQIRSSASAPSVTRSQSDDASTTDSSFRSILIAQSPSNTDGTTAGRRAGSNSTGSDGGPGHADNTNGTTDSNGTAAASGTSGVNDAPGTNGGNGNIGDNGSNAGNGAKGVSGAGGAARENGNNSAGANSSSDRIASRNALKHAQDNAAAGDTSGGLGRDETGADLLVANDSTGPNGLADNRLGRHRSLATATTLVTPDAAQMTASALALAQGVRGTQADVTSAGRWTDGQTGSAGLNGGDTSAMLDLTGAAAQGGYPGNALWGIAAGVAAGAQGTALPDPSVTIGSAAGAGTTAQGAAGTAGPNQSANRLAALAASGDSALSATAATLNSAAVALNGAAGTPGAAQGGATGSRRTVGADRGADTLAATANLLATGNAEARRSVSTNASVASPMAGQLLEASGLYTADGVAPDSLAAASGANPNNTHTATDAAGASLLAANPIVTPGSQTPTLSVSAPLGSPGWSDGFANTLQVAVQAGLQNAQIQVHPEALGPISVNITMNGNKMSLVISAATSETRALLDGSLTQLHHALNERGIQLTDSAIQSSSESATGSSTASFQQGGNNAAGHFAQSNARAMFNSNDGYQNSSASAGGTVQSTVSTPSVRLVDTFA